MDKTWERSDTRCPYSKIKLTKLSLNNSLDKFPAPLVLKNMIFLYSNIFAYTILRIFMYLCAKSIPIANKLVSLENGYRQMLTVLN